MKDILKLYLHNTFKLSIYLFEMVFKNSISNFSTSLIWNSIGIIGNPICWWGRDMPQAK